LPHINTSNDYATQTHLPIQFEMPEQTRDTIANWIDCKDLYHCDYKSHAVISWPSKAENTLRYSGIEVDDALVM